MTRETSLSAPPVHPLAYPSCSPPNSPLLVYADTGWKFSLSKTNLYSSRRLTVHACCMCMCMRVPDIDSHTRIQIYTHTPATKATTQASSEMGKRGMERVRIALADWMFVWRPFHFDFLMCGYFQETCSAKMGEIFPFSTPLSSTNNPHLNELKLWYEQKRIGLERIITLSSDFLNLPAIPVPWQSSQQISNYEITNFKVQYSEIW